MPKQRITKEMVVDAAFRLLREGGEGQVLVKNIAAELGCSVQPIYSYCENMEAIRQELSEMSAKFMREYVGKRTVRDDFFASTGKAYIGFAKEEPHLFKSFFLRNRSNIKSFEDLYAAEASSGMPAYIAKTCGISEDDAKKLHMDMIIYSSGLSFMLISAGGNFSEQELNEKLERAYNVFLISAKNGGKEHESSCNL